MRIQINEVWSHGRSDKLVVIETGAKEPFNMVLNWIAANRPDLKPLANRSHGYLTSKEVSR